MMENREETFRFTYSAQQQEEVEAIRKKYLPEEEDKMAQLRKLDASVGRKGMAASIVLGVIGSLLLGLGMSLFMTDLGAFLGAFSMILGIPVGLIGLVLVALAYPLYNHITKKERERIAPEILRLTDELMK